MTRIETHFSSRTRAAGLRGADRKAPDASDVMLTSPGSAAGDAEQLFAADWSACFIGAMQRAAEAMQVELPAGAAIDAEVDLGKAGDDYLLAARLNVSLPGLAPGAAAAVVEAAHELCAFPESVHGAVDVALTLN